VPLASDRVLRVPVGPKRIVPLPLPELMFRNLVRLWRAFSDRPFNYEGFLRWVELGG